ncbi:prepilin-type N-terminal cleavage/methylation domain-containing protein [Clostridium sp. LP20]|uniref:prepilin-type N-terminal cleavage/methylation domain-containing protein n=1 Tax=Clostridium sp. LP20 TaxID=3418665 RepID=UPI003EE80147
MIKNLKNKKKKGFTLIEIIAVVAIIAILAAVLVPKVTGYIKESRKTGVTDQARKVITAAESYRIKANKPLDGVGGVNSMNITALIGVAGDLVDAPSTNKLKGTMSVEQCRQVLDTENYTFEINDNGTIKSVNGVAIN